MAEDAVDAFLGGESQMLAEGDGEGPLGAGDEAVDEGRHRQSF